MTTSSPDMSQRTPDRDTSGEWRHRKHSDEDRGWCVACEQPWPCDAETMRQRVEVEHEAALQAGRERQDALDRERWATQRADRAEAALREMKLEIARQIVAADREARAVLESGEPT
jgi:hypothetical protein